MRGMRYNVCRFIKFRELVDRLRGRCDLRPWEPDVDNANVGIGADVVGHIVWSFCFAVGKCVTGIPEWRKI